MPIITVVNRMAITITVPRRPPAAGAALSHRHNRHGTVRLGGFVPAGVPGLALPKFKLGRRGPGPASAGRGYTVAAGPA
jgi:hypothetical protein